MANAKLDITLETIKQAHNRIKPYILETPLIPFESLSRAKKKPIFLKCENFQKMGSFKIRGASNFILNHLVEAKKMGVVTASAGNHAQGVASISHTLGISATIVMPETTPPIKVANTEALGAKVQLAGQLLDESFESAYQLSKEKGHLFVHPFMDSDIIAGQGTAALEMVGHPNFKDIEAVVIPIGGGGLFSGCACVLRDLRPDLKLYGVVAKNAPTMARSFKKGSVENLPVEFTLADGVAFKKTQPEMFQLIQKYADDIFEVSEESISHGISTLSEEAKMTSEGSAALVVGAVLEDFIPETNVALLLSGGNIDIPALSKVLYRGLVAQGRLTRLVVTISDRPGGLHRLTGALSELGVNILQVFHHRSTLRVSIGQTMLEVEMETRDPNHTDHVIKSLGDRNWKVDRIF